MKNLSLWNIKFNKDCNDKYNCEILKNLNYICLKELSCEFIVVYINNDEKKIITYFDGITEEVANDFNNLKIFNVLKFIEQYEIEFKKIISNINNLYNDYKKLYLGYCLGGYMINNHINGENYTCYTYNSYSLFLPMNDTYDPNITNYREIFDICNYNLFNNASKNRSEFLNLQNDYIINLIKNKKDIIYIFKKIKNIIKHIHSIFTVDDTHIIIYF
jgi:hypothetical protein